MRRPLLLLSSLVLLAALEACSGAATGTGDGASSGGSGTSSASGGAGTTSSSGAAGSTSGASCRSGDECANWVCRCNDGAPVNSTLCQNGSCQGPSAHCETACNTFGHRGWSGVAVESGPTNSSSSSSSTSSTSSSTSSGSGGSCTSNTDCPSFGCGCTDGSRISVRDCYNRTCHDAYSGCQSACEDSGRGDWDGT